MQIPQLGFTRFLIAASIVIHHTGADAFPFSVPWVAKIFAVPRSVSYFVTLSGFVLALAAIRAGTQFDGRTFLIARASRLYPVYSLALIISLLPTIIVAPQLIDPKAVVLNVLLLQSWFPGYALSINGPAWALSVLFSLYLLFPTAFGILSRLSLRLLLVSMCLIWVFGQIPVVIVETFFPPPRDSLFHFFVSMNPIMHASTFLVGVGGGILFSRIDQKRVIGRPFTLTVAAALAVGVLVFLLGPEREYFANGMLAPFYLLFLYGLSMDTSPLRRILSCRPSVALGDLSYCFYVLQAPVFFYCSRTFKHLGFPPDATTRFFTYLMILLVLSAAAHRYVEVPFRRFRADRSRTGPVEATVNPVGEGTLKGRGRF